MMQCILTSHPPDLHFWLGDLSDALVCAGQNLYESWHFNRKQLEEHTAGPLKVGDTVILHANERMTFTNYLDPQYEIIKIRGVVYWLEHQLTGEIKVLNRSQL